MGGVDRGDQLRGYYCCRTKSRKFYKYIFYFLLDVAITNAFILMKKHTKAPRWPSRTFGSSWRPNWLATIVVGVDVDALHPPPSAPFLFDIFLWRSMTTAVPLRGREAIVHSAERRSTVEWTPAGFAESARHGCVTRGIQMNVFCSGTHAYKICKYVSNSSPIIINCCTWVHKSTFTERTVNAYVRGACMCVGCVYYMNTVWNYTCKIVYTTYHPQGHHSVLCASACVHML